MTILNWLKWLEMIEMTQNLTWGGTREFFCFGLNTIISGGATCMLGEALAPPKFLILIFYNLDVFYKYLKVKWKKRRRS